MKKSKKTKELTQIDGKFDEEKPKYEITTVYQLFGDTGEGKYKTDKLDEYEDELNGMNLSDLQYHATTVGQIPITDRKRLITRLIGEFQRHWGPYRVPITAQTDNNNTKPDKELEKILRMGQ